MERMLKEEQKQQMLCPLSSSKSSLLRVSTFIFEKINVDIKQYWSYWMEKMLKEEQKQQILCPLSSSKSSVLRASAFISEKIIDWHQNNNGANDWRNCWEKSKTCKMCGRCLRTKLGFWALWASFWEKNDWQMLNNESTGPEDCEEKNRNRTLCDHCFPVKVDFSAFQASF